MSTNAAPFSQSLLNVQAHPGAGQVLHPAFVRFSMSCSCRFKDLTCERMVGNPETIQKRGSMIVTLCCRFRAAEGAAGESVTAFRGRRATGGSSLEAGRPRLRQRLLVTHRAGATLIAAAKWFRHSCRAENGGTKLRLGSVPAERFF